MNIVPAIITSWRDENINFGGIDITNEEDFYPMLSEVEKTYDLFCDYDPGINEIFGDSNMKKLDIYSMGNYKEKAWICDPPSSYSKVIRNSFPLKIYIKGDNFEKCKEKILNNDDRNRMWEEESYRMYVEESGQVQKGNESYGKISEPYEIKVIKLDGDVYDVPELNDYKVITIIRNPYERALSWYSYYRTPTYYNRHPQMRALHYAQQPFLEFLKWYNRSFKSKWEMLPQVWWYTHKNKLHSDYQIRFENLEQDINKVSKELEMDITFKIPHNNKSSESLTVGDVYCDESISIINEWYKEDFKKLDYLLW